MLIVFLVFGYIRQLRVIQRITLEKQVQVPEERVYSG